MGFGFPGSYRDRMKNSIYRKEVDEEEEREEGFGLGLKKSDREFEDRRLMG